MARKKSIIKLHKKAISEQLNLLRQNFQGKATVESMKYIQSKSKFPAYTLGLNDLLRYGFLHQTEMDKNLDGSSGEVGQKSKYFATQASTFPSVSAEEANLLSNWTF